MTADQASMKPKRPITKPKIAFIFVRKSAGFMEASWLREIVWNWTLFVPDLKSVRSAVPGKRIRRNLRIFC